MRSLLSLSLLAGLLLLGAGCQAPSASRQAMPSFVAQRTEAYSDQALFAPPIETAETEYAKPRQLIVPTAAPISSRRIPANARQVRLTTAVQEISDQTPTVAGTTQLISDLPATAQANSPSDIPPSGSVQEPLPFHGEGNAMHAPHGALLVGQMPGAGGCLQCGPNAGGCGPFVSSQYPAGKPLALGVCGSNWRPEGIACPWPADEYLCDGGDTLAHVRVQKDWTVQGLDLEDTVAHYDSEDGRVIVEPSNRVCIYAPRFAAVRRVDGIYSGDQLVKAGGVAQPIGPHRLDENLPALVSIQPLGPVGAIGRKRVTTYEADERGIPIQLDLAVTATQDRIKAAEAFDRLYAARLDVSLKPFLAAKALAAIVWSADQAVQVTIDGQRAAANTALQSPQIVFELKPGQPKLRIVKAASTNAAAPGETVDFVLRYENIGEQTLGNVTIIDNLTTRLEYVPDSQQSSREAKFHTQENLGESLVLRWEIAEPIKPGEGGVIVFKCKVR